MKIGIDTNMLVRYLTNDDPNQADQVQKFFNSYKSEATFIINNVVVAELDWVLTHVYDYSRDDFLMVIDLIFKTSHISFHQPNVIQQATKEYTSSSADFSDCLIGVLNEEAATSTTYTFDNKASKLAPFTLLE